MDFRINVTVEVDQVANGLAIQTPVPMQLEYSRRKWHAACSSPFVEMRDHESMESAIKAGAEQIAREAQAAVIERPLIVGRITPDSIPEGMF